jgi:urea transporter
MLNSTVTIGDAQVATLAVVFAGISVMLGIHLLLQKTESHTIIGLSIILGNILAAYGMNCSVRGGCAAYATLMFAVQLVYTFMLYQSAMDSKKVIRR